MSTEFGKALRKIRIDHDEVVRNMAAKIGVSESYLSSVETGKREVPYAWVDEIARLYGLDASAKFALSEAAHRSVKVIKLEVDGSPPENKEIAVMFASLLNMLNQSEVASIRKILKAAAERSDR